MVVWGGLANSCEKKRSEKQRRKEIYTHLNAEFQRIARRDKKAFLSDQCNEIDGKNRMGKTRDLFKIMRDTNISCKDGDNKGQKWYGTNRSRYTKKEWQEYTEELYKKDLHDPDNHDGVIIHLEPDILECEVKWALGGITTKLVDVMEFQLSYFKS